MYDISSMEKVVGEVELSRRLKLLNWSRTERFLNRNSYYNRKRECIGHTIFHPGQGPCAHTHYVLVPRLVEESIEQSAEYFDRFIAGDR